MSRCLTGLTSITNTVSSLYKAPTAYRVTLWEDIAMSGSFARTCLYAFILSDRNNDLPETWGFRTGLDSQNCRTTAGVPKLSYILARTGPLVQVDTSNVQYMILIVYFGNIPSTELRKTMHVWGNLCAEIALSNITKQYSSRHVVGTETDFQCTQVHVH